MGLSTCIMKLKLNKWKKEGLLVGNTFKINTGCSIDPSFPWLISIGNNVTLAPNVIILAHDASTQVHIGYSRLGLVEIGNNVFVGAGSIVLPGVKIGNNVVIAAGSVVTKSIPNDSVVAGVPARIIKSIDEFKNKYTIIDEEKLDISYTRKGNITNIKKKIMREQLGKGNLFIV